MRYFLILLVAFVISGCAASKFAGTPFSSLEPPPAQQAVLYFYRIADEPPAGSKKNYTISIDGNTVGTLYYGEYFRIIVAPGHHHIESDYPYEGNIAGLPFIPLNVVGNIVMAANKKPEAIDVDINPNEIKFVKVHSVEGFFNILGRMTIVPEATAVYEMRATNRIR